MTPPPPPADHSDASSPPEGRADPIRTMIAELRDQTKARDRAIDDELRNRGMPMGLIPLLITTFGQGAFGLIAVLIIWWTVFQPMLDRDRDNAKAQTEIAQAQLKGAAALTDTAAAIVKLADAITKDLEHRQWDQSRNQPRP